MASAADRGRWSLIDGGEDRVEAAQAAKAGDKRDLGHRQIGVIDHPFGTLDARRLGDLAG